MHEPVELPAEPRLFRVHSPNRRPQDCTLRPDGTITAVMVGQTWRCAFTFDEMRELDWASSRIEWDPAPLAEEPEPEQSVEAVQEPFVLTPAP